MNKIKGIIRELLVRIIIVALIATCILTPIMLLSVIMCILGL